MSQPTLRELAKAYARGELTREQYRESRSWLIEGILSGEITIPKREHKTFSGPITGWKPNVPEDTQPRTRVAGQSEAATEEAPDFDITEAWAETPSPSSHGRMLAVAAGVAVLVALGIFLFVAGADDASSPEPETRTEAAAGPAAPEPAAATMPEETTTEAAASGDARDLIWEFLQDKNWSTGRLQQFADAWNELSPENRAAADDSQEMAQLTNAIYRQLLDERALAGLGDPEQSRDRQRELIAFAEQLGIADERLTMPEEPESGDTPTDAGVP